MHVVFSRRKLWLINFIVIMSFSNALYAAWRLKAGASHLDLQQINQSIQGEGNPDLWHKLHMDRKTEEEVSSTTWKERGRRLAQYWLRGENCGCFLGWICVPMTWYLCLAPMNPDLPWCSCSPYEGIDRSIPENWLLDAFTNHCIKLSHARHGKWLEESNQYQLDPVIPVTDYHRRIALLLQHNELEIVENNRTPCWAHEALSKPYGGKNASQPAVSISDCVYCIINTLVVMLEHPIFKANKKKLGLLGEVNFTHFFNMPFDVLNSIKNAFLILGSSSKSYRDYALLFRHIEVFRFFSYTLKKDILTISPACPTQNKEPPVTDSQASITAHTGVETAPLVVQENLKIILNKQDGSSNEYSEHTIGDIKLNDDCDIYINDGTDYYLKVTRTPDEQETTTDALE